LLSTSNDQGDGTVGKEIEYCLTVTAKVRNTVFSTRLENSYHGCKFKVTKILGRPLELGEHTIDIRENYLDW
jgi:hypothetical protein